MLVASSCSDVASISISYSVTGQFRNMAGTNTSVVSLLNCETEPTDT